MRQSLYITAAALAVLAIAGVDVLATVHLTAKDERTTAGTALCQLARFGGAYERLRTFAEEEVPALSRMLTPQDKRRYESLVSSGQCVAARDLVKEHYLRRFPGQECFFEEEPLMETWRVFVASHRYKGLMLCFHEAEARVAIEKMITGGGEIPFYDWRRATGSATVRDPVLTAREKALFAIESQCRDLYQPACLSYVALDNQHGVFGLKPIWAWKMLEQARQFGLDRPELHTLLLHYAGAAGLQESDIEPLRNGIARAIQRWDQGKSRIDDE